MGSENCLQLVAVVPFFELNAWEKVILQLPVWFGLLEIVAKAVTKIAFGLIDSGVLV